MKPTSTIIARLGVQNGGPVHAFFTNTCALHMDKYTPWRTGTMARTVVQDGAVNTTNVTVDTITYNTHYAKYVYYPYRNGKEIHYNDEFHKQAYGYWDQIMWNTEKHEVIKEVQDQIKVRRGGRK